MITNCTACEAIRFGAKPEQVCMTHTCPEKEILKQLETYPKVKVSNVIEIPVSNKRDVNRDMAVNALHAALDWLEDVEKEQGKEALQGEILTLEFCKNRLEKIYERIRNK